MLTLRLLAGLFSITLCIASGAPCSACEGKGNLAYLMPSDLLARLRSYTVPTIPEGFEVSPSTGPSVIELTVGANGRPCGVQLIVNNHPALADLLRSAVMKWRFRPTTFEGKPICLQSRISFSARSSEGKPRITIDGLDGKESR